MADDRQERIRERAYAIWEREGRRDGEHQRHWHQAASEIDAEDAASAAAGPGRKAATSRKSTAAAGKPAKTGPTKAARPRPSEIVAKPVAATKPRARKAKAE